MLLDVLLHEQLRDIFAEARASGRGLNAIPLEEHPPGTEELFGGRGAVVRIEATDGRALLVTPRGLFDQEEGRALPRLFRPIVVEYHPAIPCRRVADPVELRAEIEGVNRRIERIYRRRVGAWRRLRRWQRSG